MSELSIGAGLAGYRIESLIGRGSVGTVYSAKDLALDRRVAVKVLAPTLARDERFREQVVSPILNKLDACADPLPYLGEAKQVALEAPVIAVSAKSGKGLENLDAAIDRHPQHQSQAATCRRIGLRLGSNRTQRADRQNQVGTSGPNRQIVQGGKAMNARKIGEGKEKRKLIILPTGVTR